MYGRRAKVDPALVVAPSPLHFSIAAPCDNPLFILVEYNLGHRFLQTKSRVLFPSSLHQHFTTPLFILIGKKNTKFKLGAFWIIYYRPTPLQLVVIDFYGEGWKYIFFAWKFFLLFFCASRRASSRTELYRIKTRYLYNTNLYPYNPLIMLICYYILFSVFENRRDEKKKKNHTQQ